jgi:hypothetical protein
MKVRRSCLFDKHGVMAEVSKTDIDWPDVLRGCWHCGEELLDPVHTVGI